ncbi:unnamed protein product [Nippostrongylus brasiliensis]|uniref:NR LBD domain-containing protein n=1 Tax=Nippostrongylus brasiliensis TaxID=27835 RepID=A0A0N4XQ05_NIPBR|nr:unnamed protein product [Nippostrongylus brasiliensis]
MLQLNRLLVENHFAQRLSHHFEAPGLLEEHGGHVKLKLTWAMKLVSRIAERQKEIELGLPAGSLSNMGRHQLNSLNNSLTGGGFMADMMTQNILSHHMMMNMNSQIKQEVPPEPEPKEEMQPAGESLELFLIDFLLFIVISEISFFGCSFLMWILASVFSDESYGS